MDHHRLVGLAVLGDVLEAEAGGVVEVHLDGRALPGAVERVLDLDVDLGAVEDALARVHLERKGAALQRLAEGARRHLPLLVRPARLLGLGGEVDVVALEAEGAQDVGHEIQHPQDLVLELVGAAEDVGVVLGEAPHPHETVQDARALEAVHRAELRPAIRQLAVAAQPRLVDGQVERAVHRLQLVLDVLDLDRRVHVGPVVLGVAARLPQIQPRDVGRVDEVVAAPEVLLAPVVLDLLADEAALRVPEHEPSARLVGDREEVQLAAEPAMVTPFGLLQPEQVLLQLLPGEEGVPVDALHRRVAFLALPIGLGGSGLELEGLDLLGGGEVRPQAEVDELPHRVALHGVARLLADELALEGLSPLREELQRLGLGEQLLLDRPVLLHDVRHLLLDGGEVLGREGTADQEVVEEAVLGGGTDPALGVRKELGHRRRQEVGGRVPVDLDRGIGRLGLAGGTCLVGGLDGARRHHARFNMSGPEPSSARLVSSPRGLVGAGGIEPPTSSVSRKRSTTEPRAFGRKLES